MEKEKPLDWGDPFSNIIITSQEFFFEKDKISNWRQLKAGLKQSTLKFQ
jgi:hypothetical protein